MVALVEVVGQALIRIAITEELVVVGGMRQKRCLSLPPITQGGMAVIDGLVKVAAPTGRSFEGK